MATVETILKRCKGLGLPMAKNAFQGTLEDPVPNMPYIVYLLHNEKHRGADLINNIKESDIDMELYTAADDAEREELAERICKEVLFDLEHDEFVAPVEGEDCFQTAFEIHGIVSKAKGARKA
ncbi:MAG: hypothetical protein J1E01_01195 [Acetatifactor sp.]|nr:hypothetical protein [Acetatifactor sp.]